MNKTLIVIPSGHDCVTVIIKDDDVPEPDEIFQVLFTELNLESPDWCMGGGGSGSGMMTTDHHGHLTPLVSNEAVTITIIDNDGMG